LGDGDGLPNAAKFLLGTDLLLNSNPGGPDPNPARAPVYSVTATHFQVDYRLSAANVALGSGNSMLLQPQSNASPINQWSNVAPGLISGDQWRAGIPRAAGSRQFLRFAVLA